jgi:hypothetical protein
MPNESQFDVWPCPPPGFSGSWARSMPHHSDRLMLVLSAGWSFRDSVAAPSERILDAPRAELFSVSPERAWGLSPSRCRHDILKDRPLQGPPPSRPAEPRAPLHSPAARRRLHQRLSGAIHLHQLAPGAGQTPACRRNLSKASSRRVRRNALGPMP